MGIDFGLKRIGIAFSDPFRLFASAHSTIFCKGEEQDIQSISDLAKAQDVGLIIMGLPFQMDGKEGEIALKVKDFANKLIKVSGISVVFVDERLTSHEANEILKSAKVKTIDRKAMLDKISAQIILQTYMNKM